MRPFRVSTQLRRLGFVSAVALGACKSHHGPSIPLQFASLPPPGSKDGCEDSTLEVVPNRLTAMDVSKVRVTLRSRDASGNTIDFCDRIIDFPSTPPYFKLGASNADTVDLYVEAFHGSGGADGGASTGVTRVATGSLVGVRPDDDKLGSLRLFKTEQFGCTPQPPVQSGAAAPDFGMPRAFHTATRLPDGRVLFYGGLAATPTDRVNRAFALTGVTTTDIAEIYDPRDQTRTAVGQTSVVEDMGTPADLAMAADAGVFDLGASPTSVLRPGRAFHNAALLPSSGPCGAHELAILIVGGITPGKTGEPVLTIEQGSSTVASRFQPSGPNVNSTPFDVHAASNEVFCLDPIANTGRHLPLSGTPAAFRAAAVGPAGFVVAGGIDFASSMLNSIVSPAGPDIDVFPPNGGVEASGQTSTQREGASLTILPNGQGLVWGGNLYNHPVAELLGELADAPYSTPVSVSGPTATAFHTATLLAQTDSTMPANVLITGGYAVTSDNLNIDPPLASSAVTLLSIQNGAITSQPIPFGTNPQTGANYPSAAPCQDKSHYAPAGFESAVALDRGRVLVSGGAPSTAEKSSRCDDCPANVTNTPLCALGQASLYENSTLVPTAAMAIPRFGHTSTVLDDGSVLIFGGIGQQTTGAMTSINVFLNDAELYNPRSPSPPVDMTSGIDSDDPIADLLKAQNLQRAPAGQAVSKDKPTSPVRSCGTL